MTTQLTITTSEGAHATLTLEPSRVPEVSVCRLGQIDWYRGGVPVGAYGRMVKAA